MSTRCSNPVPTLRQRSRLWVIAGVLALAALTAAGWWAWQRYDAAQDSQALILFKAGRFGEALPLLERRHRRQPGDLETILALANCRAALGQADAAQAALQKALALQPDNLAALVDLGKLCVADGQGAAAEAWLRKALTIDSTDRRAHHLLFQSLQLQGKATEAKEQLAILEQLRADLARATEIMSEAMKERPDDPDLHHELGTLMLRNGQVRQALQWLERALAIDPAHRLTRQTLAAYYDKIGQPARAAEYRNPPR